MNETEKKDIGVLIMNLESRIIERDHSVTGFNIGTNIGESAGQTIFHAPSVLIPQCSSPSPHPPVLIPQHSSLSPHPPSLPRRSPTDEDGSSSPSPQPPSLPRRSPTDEDGSSSPSPHPSVLIPQACRGVVQRTKTGPQHFPLTFNLSPLTFNLIIFYTDRTMIRVKNRLDPLTLAR